MVVSLRGQETFGRLDAVFSPAALPDRQGETFRGRSPGYAEKRPHGKENGMSMMPHESWALQNTNEGAFPPPRGAEPADARDYTGFKVEALDGSIGKVDKITREAGHGYVVVDTGPWIFGKKVMLPEATIDRVDWSNEVVYVERPRAQVENAPEFDDSMEQDETYRERLGSYYAAPAGDRPSDAM